ILRILSCPDTAGVRVEILPRAGYVSRTGTEVNWISGRWRVAQLCTGLRRYDLDAAGVGGPWMGPAWWVSGGGSVWDLQLLESNLLGWHGRRVGGCTGVWGCTSAMGQLLLEEFGVAWIRNLCSSKQPSTRRNCCATTNRHGVRSQARA